MSGLILEPYFVELWKQANLKGDPRAIAADWEARYSEPGRFYHTAEHIKEGFDFFLETPDFRCECDNPVYIMAFWAAHDLEVRPGHPIGTGYPLVRRGRVDGQLDFGSRGRCRGRGGKRLARSQAQVIP